MFGLNTSRFGWLIADWLGECKNPDMTLYGMLVYCQYKKKIQQTYHFI
jgi:hypothetical protein